MMQPAPGVMVPQPMGMDPQQQQQQQQWMMMMQQQQQQQPQTQNPPQQSQMPLPSAGVWPPQPQPQPQPPPQPQPQPPVMAMQPYPQQTLAQPQLQIQQQQPQQPAAADECRTLWIGDLQYWMDETYLHGCFAVTGEVMSVKIIRNKQTGQSEGYGFVEFVSRSAAERALHEYSKIQMPNTEQYFRLNWANSGPDYPIFVGDLAADVTDDILQETFRVRYSSVKGARVVIDKITGRSKGYGFVKFGDENEQLRAITEMNGVFCSSRPIRTGLATAKRAPPSNPNQQYNMKESGKI
eukprot:TRINITY_DN776_c0_g1_i5.p1 TRINITY_DN776_c0_g1~~TRINITY_DN776_c0_g1_i5.p1  ORF type:complete len:295 (+),score=48.97 TRINITY_DN776_c0_g1_i5:161-1045(+)